ncbi:MAG: glycosyltransferase, partial [Bacilli bacterium]|nr:glycosyltransferase [Bacilli bacterium]
TFFDPIYYEKKHKEVLIVSRLLEGHKDISKALKIWKTIEADGAYKEWSLKIVGHGPDEEYYKRLSYRYGLRTVSFEGVQDPKAYYERSSIFMITSSYEGWVLTLNEAKQNGVVPIVYNSFSALQEMVEDGQDGFIIPFNDEISYVNHLKQLMDDSTLRRTMAINAINNSRNYSADLIVKDWIKLFNEVY